MNETYNAAIRTIPAASELRKVAGFNPLKFLRRATNAQTGEKVFRLDLPYKRLWFRLACPNGRTILKPLQITDQLAIFEALVYAEKDDSEPLARFTSQVTLSESGEVNFVQAAQDSALNAALENAGFGIQLCDFVQTSGSTRYGSEISAAMVADAKKQPVDATPAVQTAAAQTAKPPVPELQVKQEVPLAEHKSENLAPAVRVPAEALPQMEQTLPPAAEAPNIVSVQPAAEKPAPVEDSVTELLGICPSAVVDTPAVAQPKSQVQTAPVIAEVQTAAQNATVSTAPGYTPDMSVEEICERMTLDEALAYTVPTGFCQGWTLAQVAERRAASLNFYVCSNGSSNVLKAAATLVLGSTTMQKAG